MYFGGGYLAKQVWGAYVAIHFLRAYLAMQSMGGRPSEVELQNCPT